MTLRSFLVQRKEKGFTLIELLVVISIIGLLASVILASLAQARTKGQNAARMEAIHQMDLAVQLYITANGHAPLLGIKSGQLTPHCGQDHFGEIGPGNSDACVAVQTAAAGTAGATEWANLKSDLAPYMSKLPVDPCGTNCPAGLGYIYVAPAAIYYECTTSPSVCSASKVTNSSYQVGNSSIGGVYTPPAPVVGSF